MYETKEEIHVMIHNGNLVIENQELLVDRIPTLKMHF